MKVVICLLAIISVCNAGYLSGATNFEVNAIPTHGGGGAASSASYHHEHQHHHGNYGPIQHSAPQKQIIKIVSEPATLGGKGEYAAVHTYGSNGIPSIIQIVLGQEQRFAHRSQLLHHYGNRGHAVVTESQNQNDGYYGSGRTVEKGTLQLIKVEENILP